MMDCVERKEERESGDINRERGCEEDGRRGGGASASVPLSGKAQPGAPFEEYTIFPLCSSTWYKFPSSKTPHYTLILRHLVEVGTNQIPGSTWHPLLFQQIQSAQIWSVVKQVSARSTAVQHTPGEKIQSPISPKRGGHIKDENGGVGNCLVRG